MAVRPQWLDGTVQETRMKSAHPYVKGRTYRIAKDQHGRPWGAECDNRTNDPVGPLGPKFRAPWYPPREVLDWQYDPAEGGFRVMIRYDHLKDTRRRDDREWTTRLMEVGVQLDGQAFDPTNPTLAVLQKVGPRPESVRVAIMAERGDAWVLGLADGAAMPAWAVPYFPPPESADDREVAQMEEEMALAAANAAADAPVDAPVTPAPPPAKRRGRAA